MEVIGELLYLTDPYIYPYWFDGDITKGRQELARLCKTKGSVFYYKNIIVAEMQGQIIGMACYFDDKADMTYAYEEEKLKNKRCVRVFDEYLHGLNGEQQKDIVNISNICVFEPFRRHGVATKLLKHLFKKYDNGKTVFQIEVVARNTPAIKLYKTQGFAKVKEYNGFSATKKVKCFLIRRYPSASATILKP